MIFKNYIRKFLYNETFEKVIITFILINLLFFILDSIADFHNLFGNYVSYIETLTVIIFTIEYILRLLLLEKFTHIFTPMMLIDFFAIIPFYLSFCTVNTAFLRILRLSKFMRIMKISRYSSAFNNIYTAFKSKKEELIITLSAFGIGVLLSAIFMYMAEYKAQPQGFSSIPKCLYFSIITFTSVGYGDIFPVTTMGKIVCCLTAVFGIAIHGLFISVLGMAFMEIFKRNNV